MDLHPIFVHFPIAFLTVYALMELVRFRIGKSNYWFYTKISMLFIGAGSILLAYSTGEEIGERTNLYPRDLINIHSFFAKGTVILFGILSAVYLAVFITKNRKVYTFVPESFRGVLSLIYRIYESSFGSFVFIIFAVTGLALLTITAGLGGLMVHGSSADPFTQLLDKIIIRF